MARNLWINGMTVVNVVDYPDTPPESESGFDVFPDPTGFTNVGDTYDATDDRKNRRLDHMDPVIFDELFRLTNESRANELIPRGPVTRQQYRAFLRGNMS